MAIGPRDRNYNTTLYGHYNYSTRPLAGGPWSVLNDSDNHQSRFGVLVVNNPWRERKPSGFSPTPRHLEHTRGISPSGEVRWRGGVEHRKMGVFSSSVGALANLFPEFRDRDRLVNEALIDALTKLKDQNFNAGVAIAEAEGVSRLVHDGAKLIVETFEAVVNHDYKRAYKNFRKAEPRALNYPSWRRKHWDTVRRAESVRTAKQIPEGWLYYHYGIQPTVNDIYAAMNDYSDRANTDPRFKDAWATVEGYRKVELPATGLHESDWIVYDLVGLRRASVKVKLSVFPKNDMAVKLSKLGVTNPAEAYWNRIPFSFVVDYFASFGDWLHVMDAWVGYDFGDWEEQFRDLKRAVSIASYDKSQDGTLTHLSLTKGTFSRKVLDRVVHRGLYGPMASVLPRVKLRGPSLDQTSKLLSLMATSFRKPPRP